MSIEDKNAAEPDWIKAILEKAATPAIMFRATNRCAPQEQLQKEPLDWVDLLMDVDLYRLAEVDTKSQTFVILFGAPRRFSRTLSGTQPTAWQG